MTIKEIQAELNKMPAALSAAGVIGPDVHLWVRANACPQIYIAGVDIMGRGFGESQLLRGDTPAKAIAAAWAFIRALPDPQAVILAIYSMKVADAINYGRGNNVPEELVDPVRRAQKATSDMMLPAPTGAA